MTRLFLGLIGSLFAQTRLPVESWELKKKVNESNGATSQVSVLFQNLTGYCELGRMFLHGSSSAESIMAWSPVMPNDAATENVEIN